MLPPCGCNGRCFLLTKLPAKFLGDRVGGQQCAIEIKGYHGPLVRSHFEAAQSLPTRSLILTSGTFRPGSNAPTLSLHDTHVIRPYFIHPIDPRRTSGRPGAAWIGAK